MTNWRQLEKNSQQHFSTLLFLALIGLTGFLVGSQYRSTTSPSESPAPISVADTENTVITELQNALQDSTTTNSASASQAETISATDLVSINTGTASELDTLPGIGPSYAKAIIDYREKNGPFVRIEDIQQVKGIGPKTFEKLKDKITL